MNLNFLQGLPNLPFTHILAMASASDENALKTMHLVSKGLKEKTEKCLKILWESLAKSLKNPPNETGAAHFVEIFKKLNSQIENINVYIENKNKEKEIKECLKILWESLAKSLENRRKVTDAAHFVEAFKQIDIGIKNICIDIKNIDILIESKTKEVKYLNLFCTLYEKSRLASQIIPLNINEYESLLKKEDKCIQLVWKGVGCLVGKREEDYRGLWNFVQKKQFNGPTPSFIASAHEILAFAKNNPTVLHQLKQLQLRISDLHVVPYELIHLLKLNKFTAFAGSPISLSKRGIPFKTLTSLSLIDMKLKKMPEIRCKNLKYLKLSHNELEAFPELPVCKKIKVIDLYHNKISTINDSCLSIYPKIENIRLSENPLKIIELSKKNENLSKLSIFNKEERYGLDAINLDLPQLILLNSFHTHHPMLIDDPLLEQFPEDPTVINYELQLKHPACTVLSKLYQKILSAKTKENLESQLIKEQIQQLFNELTQAEKNAIYAQIKALAAKEGVASLDDPQWAEHHAFDQMFRLGLAIRDFIYERTYEKLNVEQQKQLEEKMKDLIEKNTSERPGSICVMDHFVIAADALSFITK